MHLNAMAKTLINLFRIRTDVMNSEHGKGEALVCVRRTGSVSAV
jgi:hypothetical protein